MTRADARKICLVADDSERLEVATQRLEHWPCSPVEAMGRLRGYTPGRGHFLLEALQPDEGPHRFSVVGYRVRRGQLLPPWTDWLDAYADVEAAPAPEGATLAERMARGMARAHVGAFTATSPFTRLGVSAPPDAGGSLVMVGATVLVFDHRENHVVAAGPAKGNLVPRILYELEHGTAPGPLPPAPTEGARAAEVEVTKGLGIQAAPDEEKLAARIARAVGYLDEDELPALTLARAWSAPRRAADAFDIYRAWREQTDAPSGFFCDFGQTPMQEAIAVLGFARETLHLRRPGTPGPSWCDALQAVLPHLAGTARRDPLALRMLTKLEDASREFFGGAIGYVMPGGGAGVMLSDHQTLHLAGDVCIARAGVPLSLASLPSSGVSSPAAAAIAASSRAVAPAWAALARAQRASTSSRGDRDAG